LKFNEFIDRLRYNVEKKFPDVKNIEIKAFRVKNKSLEFEWDNDGGEGIGAIELNDL